MVIFSFTFLVYIFRCERGIVMEWILGEVLEELKTMHKVLKNRANKYFEEKCLYKAPIDTDDKIVAGKHEYWRGRWLEAATNCEEIEELINSIYEMIDEEAKSESDYSEHMRQLKSIGRGYIHEDNDSEPTGGLWSTEKGDVY